MTEAVVKSVRQAGVVGAGGAGFPTHLKISAAAQTIIVNGAECEPLLRVDRQLMARDADRVVRGLEAVMGATGAEAGIIALKAKYRDAYDALKQVIGSKPIKLFRLGDFFPAGDEQVLVYEITGRVVPEGGIPLQVGCVVSNVETMVNVAAAIDGIPVTDTYITVTGEVDRPLTLRLPVGTPVSEALGIAGVKDTRDLTIINGGPMMGHVLEDLSSPVTKRTKGLIALPSEHPLIRNKTLSIRDIIRRSKSTCIQCQMCSDMCPRNLLGHRLYPHLIMRGLNHMRAEDDMKTALLCCECGVCELYACPMLLSPKQVNAALKKEFVKQGLRYDSSGEQKAVSTVRDYRKIPSQRLVARLGLSRYDIPAPLTDQSHCPQSVCIPLRQHIGAPGVPVVETGQRVKKGQLIAGVPEGVMGANIHASVNGTVKKLGEYIEIESDGERGDEC